ncbi:replicative helicase [Mycobacterium phage Adawi]|uniref:Replicative helicase n=1 Tax=Mycobacterium phage Adawi TaxID=1354507 RepID=T2A8V5_9CAUD|nr:replicative helicase [Mycobacterium phage Adawi]AGU92018.1 replicative helicase [Mycobacterium phage Adawi]
MTTAPQPRRRITMPDATIGFIEGPVTGTDDIDWLSSVTTKQVRRYPAKDDDTTVEHIAHFGVKPGSVTDMLAEYSRTTSFQPEFLIARWNDGELRSVVLSGPQRLKSGGVSDKITRKREWREYRSPVDKADLPGPVAAALTAYERAVAGVAANGGDHE